MNPRPAIFSEPAPRPTRRTPSDIADQINAEDAPRYPRPSSPEAQALYDLAIAHGQRTLIGLLPAPVVVQPNRLARLQKCVAQLELECDAYRECNFTQEKELFVLRIVDALNYQHIDHLYQQGWRLAARAWTRGKRIRALTIGNHALTGALADALSMLADTIEHHARRVTDLEHALTVEESAHAITRHDAINAAQAHLLANKENELRIRDLQSDGNVKDRVIERLRQQIDDAQQSPAAAPPENAWSDKSSIAIVRESWPRFTPDQRAEYAQRLLDDLCNPNPSARGIAWDMAIQARA